jgi:hypothetical protein
VTGSTLAKTAARACNHDYFSFDVLAHDVLLIFCVGCLRGFYFVAQRRNEILSSTRFDRKSRALHKFANCRATTS